MPASDKLTKGKRNTIRYKWDTKLPVYHQGEGVNLDEVYSLTEGLVISVSDYRGIYAVTVQCNHQECIRYCNLKDTPLKIDDKINAEDFIGNTAEHYVHIEYCTTTQDDSIWTVRVGGISYYKHDPEKVVSGEYEPMSLKSLAAGSAIEFGEYSFSDDQEAEFSESRGRIISDYAPLP